MVRAMAQVSIQRETQKSRKRLKAITGLTTSFGWRRPLKKTYCVTDIADAKDYLADTFGVSRTKMKTKEDVLAVAKEFGVELEGLE